MKKISRFLMIGAVALAGLSAIWLTITLLFQRVVLNHNYGMVMEGLVDKVPPMVPVRLVVSCFGILAVVLVMLFLVCNGKFSWKLDAVCAGILAVGLPLLSWGCGALQNYVVTKVLYVSHSTYLSLLNSVCAQSQTLMGLATALAFVACGMSIAVKYLNNKK